MAHLNLTFICSLLRDLPVDPRYAKEALHVMLLTKGVTDCHVPITVVIQRGVMPGGGLSSGITHT